MPKQRVKLQKKPSKGTVVVADDPSVDASSLSVPSPETVVPATTDIASNSEEINATYIDEESSTIPQKRKKLQTDLTEDEEQIMVDWLAVNPVIYNKKLKVYKDTNSKDFLWREQASRLGKDVVLIKTWYNSIRTRYGRLRKIRSRAADQERTERDNWILRSFDFLRPHIIEVQKRTVVSLVENIASAPAEETETVTFTDEHDEQKAACIEPQATVACTTTNTVPTSTCSSKAKSSDQTILADLASGRERLISLQRELLDRLNKPQEMQKRDAFLDWVSKAVADFDKSLWRRFQYDLQHLVNRYIDMQDRQISQPTPASDQTSNPCPMQWQPGPRCWSSNVVNPTSVWRSQDASWVQQQQYQQPTRPVSTPLVRSSTPEASSVESSGQALSGLSFLMDMDNQQQTPQAQQQQQQQPHVE